MTRRALGGFILINVVVSLVVAFLALQLWSMLSEDDGTDPQVPQARPVVVTATPRPGELPVNALEGTIQQLETRVAAAPDSSDTGGQTVATSAPTQDNTDPLPTPNATALPPGVPPLDPTVLARVTLPAGDTGDSNPGTTGGTVDDEFPGCERYVVQQGDTCIAIADKTGVDVNELIQLNGLNANCTDLLVDQELLLPSEACSLPPTATPTPTVTRTPFTFGTFSITNTPLPTATNASVEIVQVLNFGDVTTEQVDIRNTSNAVVNLTGWRLRDEDDNTFVFPDVLMQPGQIIRIFTRQGDDTPAALYWNQTTAVWARGELVTLTDDTGALQSTFTVGGETIEFEE